MKYEKDLLASLTMTEADAMNNIIAGKPFSYFGVITEVTGNGVVKVVPSVIESEEGYFEVNCVLATIASQSVTVKIEPHVGDKVRVYSPQRYSNKMFLLENNSPLIAKNSRGYSLFTGIAVLENQYQVGMHKNYISIDNGKVETHLAYDKDNDTNNAVLKIDGKGKLTYSNPKATVTVSDDGSFTLENEKTTLTIDSSGKITLETDGKFSFKNASGKNLYTILKGTFQVLNQSLSTFGSPASHVVRPQQFALQEADLDALME